MEDCIPISALEESDHALLVVDAEGRACLCNEAAARLLDCDASEAIGRRCWELAGLETRRREPFCSPDCPIQRALREDLAAPTPRLIRPSSDGPDRPLRLLTVPLPDEGRKRQAVLHLMLPLESDSARTTGMPHEREAAMDPDRLAGLSPRETQVLRLIAGGGGTDHVAHELGICRNTVRNHVQSILRKLHVHQRLDAVLALLRPASE